MLGVEWIWGNRAGHNIREHNNTDPGWIGHKLGFRIVRGLPCLRVKGRSPVLLGE